MANHDIGETIGINRIYIYIGDSFRYRNTPKSKQKTAFPFSGRINYLLSVFLEGCYIGHIQSSHGKISINPQPALNHAPASLPF